jgi:hypothetical protein
MKRLLPLLALFGLAALGAAMQFIAFKLVVLW